MIEVREKTPVAPYNGYRKGTLLQAKKVVEGKRNIYLVLEDTPSGREIRCIRMVSNVGASNKEFEICEQICDQMVELFHGELVIKNG